MKANGLQKNQCARSGDREVKMTELSHVRSSGEAKMVDISEKADTVRVAVASGKVLMKPETMSAIKSASLKKGDVIATARIAGIMAAKKTPELIPLCHTILLNEISVDFDLTGTDQIGITATVKSTGKTGVEMEALVATSVAALTIYDMAKAVDKGMTITDVRLDSKTGGKSGTYRRV
jgi:cyclic pyranopterin monophosphate synthase